MKVGKIIERNIFKILIFSRFLPRTFWRNFYSAPENTQDDNIFTKPSLAHPVFSNFPLTTIVTFTKTHFSQLRNTIRTCSIKNLLSLLCSIVLCQFLIIHHHFKYTMTKKKILASSNFYFHS